MTKVFLAGATGAIGSRLVPQLLDTGHEVVAMTRSRAGARSLSKLGAVPVLADGLDRTAVMRAVIFSDPEVVIHEMTALTGVTSVRRFDREFAETNRLRTQGTDHLLDAAKASGARRFIAQSFGNWYDHAGPPAQRESDPLESNPPREQRRSFAAVRYLENDVLRTVGIEGLVLRYGGIYGPGTGLTDDTELTAMVRKRRFPIIGDGAGVWSFVHVDDAAAATVAAIEAGESGIYNVADDEPAPVADWLPELARALDAPPPRRVPVWLGRLVAGEVAVSMMTRWRGADNGKAKRELGWTLRYPTWREGFQTGLSDSPGTATRRRSSASGAGSRR